MKSYQSFLIHAFVLASLIIGPGAAHSNEDVTEEIVVRGVRDSLAQSIDAKRQADRVVDVITSEDIGELPDENLAEALQRVTGVQITRDAGEGRSAQIRGLAAQVQINGRTILGPTGRSVDFRVFSSDVFNTVEVSKSPTADQIEGALGGVINLQTRRPLSFDERTISGSAQASYADFTDSFDPRLSLMYADQFNNDTMGLLINLSYSERSLRQDIFTSRGGYIAVDVGDTIGNTGFDFGAGDDGELDDVLRPSNIRLITQDDDRERIGVDATFQWRPTDELEIRLEGTYAKFKNFFRDHVLTLASTNRADLDPTSAVVSSQGTLLAATLLNQRVQADGRDNPEFLPSLNVGGVVEWNRDRLSAEFDLSYARSKRDGLQQILRWRADSTPSIAYDLSRGLNVPDIVIGGGSFDLISPSDYRADLTFNHKNERIAEEYAAMANFEYDLDVGPINSIKFGARYADRTNENRQFNQSNEANNANNPNYYDAQGNPLTAADAPLSGLIGEFPFGDGMFPGSSANIPRSWIVTDYPGSSGPGGSQAYIATLQPGGPRAEQPLEFFDISEATYAGYFMANADGELLGKPYRANVGVRVIRTELSSAGKVGTGGNISDIVIDNSYTDVLPSANIAWELSEDLIARASIAKVMQRPPLSELSTGFITDFTSLTARGGNPELDPFRANQYDVSFEWYFADEALASVTLFYKDVENFTRTVTTPNVEIPGLVGLNGETLFTVSRPENAGSGEIKGFEVGYQQPLTMLPEPFDDFGIVANYTYSDSETETGEPLPELSQNSYNLIGYYDNGTFDVRVAYNWRDAYNSPGDGGNIVQPLGIFEFVDEIGQLDASVRYDFSDSLSLTLEALNLTDAEFIRYAGTKERLRDFQLTDRRFVLGLRGRF